MKIFIDSDAVISAIISQTGAMWYLQQKIKNKEIKGYISNLSQVEIIEVAKRLSLSKKETQKAINSYDVVSLPLSLYDYAVQFEKYIYDLYDGHIIAGASQGKVNFLLTFNFKDFNHEKIKRDLNIIIMTPGMYLQYLRSQE